jgi:hypothetical protein
MVRIARTDSLSKKKERVREAGLHQEWRSRGRRRARPSGGAWPIPLWQQIQATEIAFAVENAVSGAGKP